MANLSLHFDIAPGADAAVLADQLETGLASLPGVEKSNAKVLESRDPLAIASAVMTFITVAPVVMNKAADFITAIKNLVNSCEGLHNAVVEIKGRRIPINRLQPSDIEAAAGPKS